MPDETIVCMACGYKFTFEETERLWLLKQVEDGVLEFFAKPKRCRECRRKKKQYHEGLLHAAPVKSIASVGTDQCGCKVAPDAPFPACPHDIRGAKGATGEPGVPQRVITPSVRSAASPPTVAVARDQAPPAPVPVKPAAPSPPAPAPIAPLALRPVLLPREEEVRVILLSDDYERLLCREEIVWRDGSKKVRIILADIGFPAMKAALERAMLKWLKS